MLTLELAEIVAAWPLGVSMAAAVVARGLYAGRRRTALNEALHELRRPLQALALATPVRSPEPTTIEWSVQMAATALERLEREINGGGPALTMVSLSVRPLLEGAIGRWRLRASSAGGSLDLRWLAGEAMVDGDRCEIAQALDNLIVNAIEHGGSAVRVEARRHRGRLRVAVIDSGAASWDPAAIPKSFRPAAPWRSARGLVRRLSGRRRHGHGLRVVRRTAAAHGGRFRLLAAPQGTEAILELPLADTAMDSA